jgi:hypothetical protein
MTWSTAIELNVPQAVADAKTANRQALESALALRGVDSDAGVFTHRVTVLTGKLAARTGREATVETTWTGS